MPVAFQTAAKQLIEHTAHTDLGAVAAQQVQQHARQADMNEHAAGLRCKLASCRTWLWFTCDA